MPELTAETNIFESGPLTQLEISLLFEWGDGAGNYEMANTLMNDIRAAILPVIAGLNPPAPVTEE